MSRFAPGVAAMVLAACYSPTRAVGVPCTSMGKCPDGQHCDYTVLPPACAPGEARADAAVDAPQTCTTAADCTGASPICDSVELICRGCVADVECGNDVCIELDGTCVGANNALFVSATGVTTGTCPPSDPCALSRAMALVANNRRVIAVADGTYTTPFDLRSFGANSLVVSGPDRDPAGVRVVPGSSSGLLTADTGRDVLVEGITILNAALHGVDNLGNLTLSRVAIQICGMHGIASASSPSLRVLDSFIASNGLRGIEIVATSVEIARSMIIGNGSGGVSVDTAGFVIENSVITANGSGIGSTGGLRFANIATQTPQTVRFNTFADNFADIGLAPGVDCGGAAIAIDSSIIMDNTPGAVAVSSTCSPTFSMFAITPPAGMGNFMGVPAFSSAGDYHIGPSSAAREAGNPAATLVNDIDGEVRPQGGYRRDVGADEVP